MNGEKVTAKRKYTKGVNFEPLSLHVEALDGKQYRCGIVIRGEREKIFSRIRLLSRRCTSGTIFDRLTAQIARNDTLRRARSKVGCTRVIDKRDRLARVGRKHSLALDGFLQPVFCLVNVIIRGQIEVV